MLLAGVLLWHRAPRFARGLVAVGAGLFWALSTPWLAGQMVRTLETPPLTNPESVNVQAIVILGGGNRPAAPEYGGKDVPGGAAMQRLAYGAFLHRKTGLPILVTGGAPGGGEAEGPVMARTLRDQFGVPTRWVEAASLDTLGNARLSAALLKADGISRVLVVSQAWHLRRAVQAFAAEGLEVIPAGTNYAATTGPTVYSWLPSTGALNASRTASHEWLGLLTQSLRR